MLDDSLRTSEEFKKHVEELMEKYGLVECLYENCVKEFSDVKLSDLSEKSKIRIMEPFLLTWGLMGRHLGSKGVTKICEKLRDIGGKIEPLRRKDLFSINLDEFKELIIRLFDEIRVTTFKSEKGKRKEVGSTATSKVLHLACPDLFVMWDHDIRRGWGCNKYKGDGRDYYKFLTIMKRRWIELETTINELSHKYNNKRPTRILDQYNWMKYHNK